MLTGTAWHDGWLTAWRRRSSRAGFTSFHA
jgi:hypothetical protein